jgi:hypothetical protein
MSTYNPRVFRPFAVIVLLWTINVGVARADSATEALERVSGCSAIEDSAERLKCFDRVAPAAKEAQAPKAADFGKPTPPAREVAQVVATVRELSRTVRGQAVFILDNGQVWRQIDGDGSAVRDSVTGSKATIERGLFGSFNLVIEGRNGLIKVRRVE